jgi:DNA-binding NtrC family response regulator
VPGAGGRTYTHHVVTPAPPRVLIADDQPDVVDALRLLLKAEGFAVSAASSPAAALAALDAGEADVVLADLNYTRDTTSGHEGLDLLSAIRDRDESLSVVVMTAWASIDIAVEAMRRGARDFVGKPWDNQRLVTILRTQADLTRALRRSRRLESENRVLAGEPSAPAIVGESPAMRRILELIHRIGPSDANVLLLGENGVGKGTIAKALHAASGRRQRPLVTVNVGGLSEGVFESELFGHVKGAFTDARADRLGRFDLADAGTLFLDEIANIPMALQAKLLRVVESGEFEPVGSSRTKRADVRLITATNADIDREIAGGRFREDLLFRLNTIEMRIPPLRERRDDIPALAQRFLEVHAQRYRKAIRGLDASALHALVEHSWPGNVRELEHTIERAVLLTAGHTIRQADLVLRTPTEARTLLEDMSLEDVEAFLVKKALARFDGNVSRAADALGLSRSALYRRMERYGL